MIPVLGTSVVATSDATEGRSGEQVLVQYLLCTNSGRRDRRQLLLRTKGKSAGKRFGKSGAWNVRLSSLIVLFSGDLIDDWGKNARSMECITRIMGSFCVCERLTTRT